MLLESLENYSISQPQISEFQIPNKENKSCARTTHLKYSMKMQTILWQQLYTLLEKISTIEYKLHMTKLYIESVEHKMKTVATNMMMTK